MSKIVENDRNLLKDALAEYNAIKEEAIMIAKDRLAKSMPDVIEKFLKEELEKSMEEGIISTEESMIKPQGSSVMETMKDTVSESEDMEDEEHSEEEDKDDEELTAEAIKEALAELEEGMYEEEELDVEKLDEHDLELELKFDDEGLHISGDAAGDEIDFEDEFEVEMDDESEEESDEDEIEIDMEDESDDEDEMESEDEGEFNPEDLEDEEESDDELEEGKGPRSFAHKRTQAGKLGSSKYDQKFLRPAVRQESALKKDIDKLIKENEELRSINLEFKDALKKYKTQLYEMAVFNANLSHVNNLFVEHTTTVNEKKEILNKFKSVATIEESKSVYNQFVSTLNESKKAKKTIEEMVEKPSVGGDSGSQKLNESLQSNKEDENIKAIKKMMKYIETRKK